MSSSVVTQITPLLDSHGRKKDACQRIFGAATEMLDESSYAALSMPAIAERARMTPPTLFAHFPSKEALIAELFLDRVRALPLCVDRQESVGVRVSAQLRAIALVLADEPNLGPACTRALLGTDDAAVAVTQVEIAMEVGRRIAAALGTGAWPEVQSTLETVFWGALLQAQSRFMDFHRMAAHLDTMVALVLQDID